MIEETYLVPFKPPFGSQGTIEILPSPAAEVTKVTFWGGGSSLVLWGPEFTQFLNDLQEAKDHVAVVGCREVAIGTFRARIGKWLEITYSSSGWSCNIGQVAQLHNVEELQSIIDNVAKLRAAIAEAVSAFRRLKR